MLMFLFRRKMGLELSRRLFPGRIMGEGEAKRGGNRRLRLEKKVWLCPRSRRVRDPES